MSERRALARPAEVAEFLGVPVGTLANWRYRGEGPRWVKVGEKQVRYRWSDIEAHLVAQSHGPKAAA